ncbi:MAG TPA: hypothetical protein PKD91_06230 [Bacteroidia bacterium]|nr:hypothetical protein [Bacteroidia bacterium]
MDAVWHGIAAFFEWIFAIAKPMGRMVNIFFIAVGFIGTAYWLMYGEKVRKGGHNYLADNADKK